MFFLESSSLCLPYFYMFFLESSCIAHTSVTFNNNKLGGDAQSPIFLEFGWHNGHHLRLQPLRVGFDPRLSISLVLCAAFYGFSPSAKIDFYAKICVVQGIDHELMPRETNILSLNKVP